MAKKKSYGYQSINSILLGISFEPGEVVKMTSIVGIPAAYSVVDALPGVGKDSQPQKEHMATKKKAPAPKKPKEVTDPISHMTMTQDLSKDAIARMFETLEQLRMQKPNNMTSAEFMGQVFYAFQMAYPDADGNQRLIHVLNQPIMGPELLEWFTANKKWLEENPE